MTFFSMGWKARFYRTWSVQALFKLVAIPVLIFEAHIHLGTRPISVVSNSSSLTKKYILAQTNKDHQQISIQNTSNTNKDAYDRLGAAYAARAARARAHAYTTQYRDDADAYDAYARAYYADAVDRDGNSL
ncbi:unnamed protein product [Adineta steineri]|uniref:Uncharacterized protein n=1 Tax=Adineta steineri TaxID=433720 RepID=A0A814KCB0_9BILA|nr:unnamed protein product [Adineta steineri]CAF1141728.1 unnamed protein product [Adineta steineri]